MNQRLDLTAKGIVQGVGFRFSVSSYASGLGLTGFVRNLPNGNVEVIAEGKKEKLQKLIEFIRKGGHYARIEQVEERWLNAKNEFNSFEIEY
ncbi:MAG: acylphosphatase [Candidatus Diapherotrites archaeon]